MLPCLVRVWEVLDDSFMDSARLSNFRLLFLRLLSAMLGHEVSNSCLSNLFVWQTLECFGGR